MVEHVEILVEEPSMAEALRQLLPGALGATTWEVYEHRCKDDLLRRLPERLRAYAGWLGATTRVVVVVDRDDDACDELKGQLEAVAHAAGLGTPAKPKRGVVHVVNRLAIEALEAWFSGDWEAVCAAYPKDDPNVPQKAPYRDPDNVKGGTWEALERVLQAAGYHAGGLAKKQAAREIARHMDPTRNRSHSFGVFWRSLQAMAT